ncbi:Beta-barrel assembly-enhancing protease [compost metagenome]
MADQTIRSKSPKLVKDEFVPLELILEGHFEKGAEAYQKSKKENSNHEQLSEGFLNSTGYELLHQNKTTQAIDLFRVNTRLYPNSENVYDSLGEAYLKAGKKDKAKQSYQQLIKINPKNERAIQILETL